MKMENNEAANKVKKGSRIRLYRDDGKLDEVVYTVQGLVRRGRKSLPWIADCWQPVVVTRWVIVP